MTVSIRVLTGADILSVIDGLAHLRAEVFRAFPYLYDGNPADESDYLTCYGDDPNAILVGAWDGDAMIGAGTGMPLLSHGDAKQMVLPADAPAREDIYYCAESVLLPAYRGQGIGHAFFEHRESQARQAGFDWSAFAAVIRPVDHPLRPEDYRPLDPFWRKRGYAPLPGGLARFNWTDIGTDAPTDKDLQVWLRPL